MEGERETGKGKDLTFRLSISSKGMLLDTMFLVKEKLILLFLLSDEDQGSSELEICLFMR